MTQEQAIHAWRTGWRSSLRRGGWIVACCLLAAALIGLSGGFHSATAQTQGDAQLAQSAPLMAYYYIWYDTQSWSRAKNDFPLLGRYSSDDPEVMRQHIKWAKAAGIDGFIVSWKSTYRLDNRLEKLIAIAEQEHFWLWIIYQGLDFDRNALPIEHIEADLGIFVRDYADRAAFGLTNRPVVIWSGTWEYTPEEIALVTSKFRDRLQILASERNVAGYARIAELVDGNAYYWSSVDPQTNTNYLSKLKALAESVHAHGGLWVAPAAPGFDARLVGGTSVVERRHGDTLRQELAAAFGASPDAVGLISWNEFSENSHVEPSREYGSTALDVLAEARNRTALPMGDFDSSAPAVTDMGDYNTLLILGGLLVLVLGSVVTVARRSNSNTATSSQRISEL
ncbi:endo-1,3-alpha-glucanase family glycosylhydrolase [Caldilinea sp.]|uniref:endo-1,3-alpha-glucanase family glycosylhydrolase n=1 Tax=Caldilinea sp. TaxID=2293560 RepID=UPI002CCAA911|nr:hypothetical protein [Anaerolineales bacterium]HQY89964.1 endo-1,3-alpha-glucanase family glycosylhydrolase [Caldilinea sp.]HRA65269.1 endo-1,3-alpha-glucanase family glycosylhydrolase [Caldilinea sp.]